MLKAPISSCDMADHLGQLHLGSPQHSPSLAKQRSFCRPTFNRVGRASVTASPATPSYFSLLQPELLTDNSTSPPTTPSESDLLKPEPNNDRLGPRANQGDSLTYNSQSNSLSIYRSPQQQQQQSSSVCYPVRPTFTRICGPQAPKQSATFPPLSASPLTSLGSPSTSSPTSAPAGEPGTKEGSISLSTTVSAPVDVSVAAESDLICLTSQPGSSEEKGSTASFHKRPAFHRDRFPSPPPALYSTYTCLTLKNSAKQSAALSSASTSSSSASPHLSAGSTPLASCATAATLTTAASNNGDHGTNNENGCTSPAQQDFLIEADLPYPTPATLQERQVRQRKRAEQLRQLKIREEREARDRRRSISLRRRNSTVSSPTSASSAKAGGRGSASSARTPKVAFDLRRTKVFEYDATGKDWDMLTIRTLVGSPTSSVSPVSPVSPVSLCSLFSPPQPSSPSFAMDENTNCNTNGVDDLLSRTVSQSGEIEMASVTPISATQVPAPATDVEMEMTT
ncbi:hypothetical protein BGW42_006153 [Actinomortierella wolfii]|nr:hypothetical protein BGW42_006153 [Actinomortierella wolfii]